jgi:hypothetical protein
VHCVRRREPAGSKVAARTRRDLASPYSGSGAGRKHTRGSARQCSEARCRMWLWGLACVKPKRAHQEEKAPASCRGLRLVVVPSRLESCRSLLPQGAHHECGAETSSGGETEKTEIVPGSGVRTVLVIINESPRPTCRAHRTRRAGGPEDPRTANEPRNSIKKVRHPAAPSDTPWSCFTFFTQFSPLTKEVSVSFRVSHNATSVFASVRRDVLVRSYSVGVVAIEYRTVLRA